MMASNDTIAAISTPVGMGGIGIIRISGPQALAVGAKLIGSDTQAFSRRPTHTLFRTHVCDPLDGRPVDECLVSVMRAPRSYTREDVVEVNAHSGAPSMRRILEIALGFGARLAEPGEFTKRAFLSGRLDLSQAEAIASLIRARSAAAARAAAYQAEGHLSKRIARVKDELLETTAYLEAAVDFSDEDIEALDRPGVRTRLDRHDDELQGLIEEAERGQVYDQGLRTALVGRPNVGKSSLLNALSREERAIVSAQPGTTRDIVESTVLLGEVPLLLRDTAGWRDPSDDIEAEGIARSQAALDSADLVVLVLAGNEPLSGEDEALIDALAGNEKTIVVINKTDLPSRLDLEGLPPQLQGLPRVELSATTGTGLKELESAVLRLVGLGPEPEANEMIIADARQREELRGAQTALLDAREALDAGFGEEIMAPLVKDAVGKLALFVGEDVDEAVLDRIFARFCIGK